jgi:predicted outer membrane repeat protein
MKIKQMSKTLFALIALFTLLGVASAQGATLTVVTTADGGAGSLRQAIIDATANAEANTVTFDIPTSDPGFNAPENKFTITLASPLPDVPLAPLTLDNSQARGVAIKGNNTFRIFLLVSSAVVVMNNLTISNGSSYFPDRGQLADGGAPVGGGGGIYMSDSSTLTLNNCTVSDNSVSESGGGVYMSNSATLNLNSTTLSGNYATNGGGIYMNDSGTLNINASTASSNIAAGGNGGAIFNGTSGTINATSNTFDGNFAGNAGGAIYNTATLTATSNTVSSNTAGSGGGIYNNFTATLNNNIVALNNAEDGADLLGRGDLGLPFTGTYNLIGNADGSEGVSSGTNHGGSLAAPIDPRLGPLQNNGGPTLTRALLADSPAIDMGNSPSIILDQRGWSRPIDNMLVPNQGNGADAGAFESQLMPTSATVSISGRVMQAAGATKSGVSGAIVSVSGADGTIRTTRSTSLGFYQFSGVSAGQTYVVNASHKSYQFSAQAVNVIDDIVGLNFVAGR